MNEIIDMMESYDKNEVYWSRINEFILEKEQENN